MLPVSVISLIKTRDRNDTKENINITTQELKNDVNYYVSGSINFIKSVKSILIENGIKKEILLMIHF